MFYKCFVFAGTSLSAQSWQDRDRRKPEAGTSMYSYRMTSMVLYNAQYHIDGTAHFRPLNSLEGRGPWRPLEYFCPVLAPSLGPGAAVNAACLESRGSRARTPLWHSSFKETQFFFSVHSYKLLV